LKSYAITIDREWQTGDGMDQLAQVLAAGIGATVFMDGWNEVRHALTGAARPNYALVGRWLGHMAHGRFVHPAIATSPPVRSEHALGWLFHYLTGIAFATLLAVCAGPAWFAQPTLAPALLLGVATVAAPFLLMQPCMGAGIAASRTARPGAARLQSLINHAAFGLGLYVSASAATLFR
jgi:hypothetical protein